MFRPAATAALVLAFGLAGAARAAPPKKGEDQAFAARLAALEESQGLLTVKMAPGDDPADLPAAERAPSGVVNVAHGRMGLYKPPLLTSEDVQAVVQQHMVDIRACYKKQLDADPEWADRLILDLAIKKTGRVSEVDVSPNRVRKAVLGQCLMSAVPKWKFPEFTGETEGGITQEVINASFPFAFNSSER